MRKAFLSDENSHPSILAFCWRKSTDATRRQASGEGKSTDATRRQASGEEKRIDIHIYRRTDEMKISGLSIGKLFEMEDFGYLCLIQEVLSRLPLEAADVGYSDRL